MKTKLIVGSLSLIIIVLAINFNKNKMGIFDFWKKNKKTDIYSHTKDSINLINELKLFSEEALKIAKSEIEETGTFLPFGGVLSSDSIFQLIVYYDVNNEIDNDKDHFDIIEKMMAEEYLIPKNNLFFTAIDIIYHLEKDDVDAIRVIVKNKEANLTKMFIYPYKKGIEGVNFVDIKNPIETD